jgi:predicted nucleic acid-binding protein
VPGYFVDTSALAKLYHPEIGSVWMESLVQTHGARLIISQLSLIEIQSVFATKVRTGVINKSPLPTGSAGTRRRAASKRSSAGC